LVSTVIQKKMRAAVDDRANVAAHTHHGQSPSKKHPLRVQPTRRAYNATMCSAHPSTAAALSTEVKSTRSLIEPV